MKTKFSVLVALFISATMVSYAQGGGFRRLTPEQRLQNVMARISDPLQLDTVQRTKTAAVFTDFFNAQDKARQDAMASGQRPDRSQFQKLINDRDDQLKGIFTADQFKKFKDELEPGLRPGGYGGPRNGGN